MATGTDLFVNRATASVTESATNTMSFTKLESGVSIFEKVAFIVHRVEYIYDPAAVQTNMVASTDVLEFGWVRDSQLSSFPSDDPSLIDHVHISFHAIGAATAYFMPHAPFVRDYSSLPGGGLIIPSSPIYLAIKGTGATVVNTVSSVMYFTVRQLKADEYWELVESTRVIS